jgi:hypothetical protein
LQENGEQPAGTSATTCNNTRRPGTITADIVHLVNVKAPGKRCVRGVEQKQGLSGWWTEDVHAEPKVGIVAKFRFGADGGCDMEILALQRDSQVCWRCVTHLSGDEWIGTELSFELRAKDGGTDLVFVTGAGRRRPTFCATAASGGRFISSV